MSADYCPGSMTGVHHWSNQGGVSSKGLSPRCSECRILRNDLKGDLMKVSQEDMVTLLKSRVEAYTDEQNRATVQLILEELAEHDDSDLRQKILAQIAECGGVSVT